MKWIICQRSLINAQIVCGWAYVKNVLNIDNIKCQMSTVTETLDRHENDCLRHLKPVSIYTHRPTYIRPSDWHCTLWIVKMNVGLRILVWITHLRPTRNGQHTHSHEHISELAREQRQNCIARLRCASEDARWTTDTAMTSVNPAPLHAEEIPLSPSFYVSRFHDGSLPV